MTVGYTKHRMYQQQKLSQADVKWLCADKQHAIYLHDGRLVQGTDSRGIGDVVLMYGDVHTFVEACDTQEMYDALMALMNERIDQLDAEAGK